ncbi:MAG: hypothetical protein NVS3B21_03590 [Acidimicrobiales bacterium]
MAVGDILGAPVGIAVPVQRRDPRLVLGVCAVELVVAAVALITLSGIAFALTALAAVALVIVRASDQRRIVAITSSGVVVLAASLAGRPLAAVGPGPRDLRFPPPAGLGVQVRLGERTWWVERADFARLHKARELLGEDRDHA